MEKIAVQAAEVDNTIPLDLLLVCYTFWSARGPPSVIFLLSSQKVREKRIYLSDK